MIKLDSQLADVWLAEPIERDGELAAALAGDAQWMALWPPFSEGASRRLEARERGLVADRDQIIKELERSS